MADTQSESAPVAEPETIGGCEVERVLAPSLSYLALGPGGREVVLKKLDVDCLFGGKLHPSIDDRLSRVRELAHPGVANLHGVVREGADAYLIWEYVPGRTLADYLSEPNRTPRDLMVVARELLLSVDSMHLQGIIHGAISPFNVLVLPDGSLRLTHVSPLLYTEPEADTEAVVSILQEAVERQKQSGSPLGLLLAEAAQQKTSLRALGGKVAALLESRERMAPERQEAERHLRRRAILGALVVALLGLVLGYAAWRAMDGISDVSSSHWTTGNSSAK